MVGLLTAGLTACYMFRAVFMTFESEPWGNAHERNHLHESPPVMTMPLAVLAVGAAIAGLIDLEAITFGEAILNFFHHLLEPSIAENPRARGAWPPEPLGGVGADPGIGGDWWQPAS